jgi:hypothetical protein
MQPSTALEIHPPPSLNDQIWANERETPKPKTAKPWYASEEKTLRDCWAACGTQAAALELARSRLVERSPAAIYQRAQRLGLAGNRPERKRGRIKQIWEPSEVIDQAIRQAYQGVAGRKGAAAVGRQYGRPAWWVARRAAQLGLSQPRGKEPPWTDAECDILREREGQQLHTIRAALKKAGFARTETAIRVKLLRLSLTTAIDDPDWFTAPQLGEVFGVDGQTVARGVEKGWLKARDVGKSGQSYWRIRRSDARKFVFAHPEAVDLRKVERFGFLALLEGA